jgi:hypothetical protein
MPSPSKVPVIVTRQRLNAELHPPIPKAGQFHEVCVCVGKIALQYFALARAYSILCGPAPVGGTLMQKGRHNAMVRELMMHFHSAMDNAVYVKFDSRQRLLVGKQVANSNNPVWDEADGAKSSPLSLVFMREHCSFKTDFSSVLYNSAASSWFNSSGPSDARIDPETKTVFVRLRQKVKEFAELHNVAILPSVPGQWWFSFARDAVDASGVASALTSPSLSVAVKAKRSPPSSLIFNSESLSLAGSFAAASQVPSVPPAVVVAATSSKESFNEDRPRFGVCQDSDPRAVLALKAEKVSKAKELYDCNALGLREGGRFPRYANKDSWQGVVDARVSALKVEAKRRRVTADFVFNALGETRDGKNFFQFCSHFEFQRSVFPHDEVTQLSLTAYDDLPSESSVLHEVKADVVHLRKMLGRKEKEVADDTELLVRDYRRLAKSANKRAREEGVDLGIYLTESGLLWTAGGGR